MSRQDRDEGELSDSDTDEGVDRGEAYARDLQRKEGISDELYADMLENLKRRRREAEEEDRSGSEPEIVEEMEGVAGPSGEGGRPQTRSAIKKQKGSGALKRTPATKVGKINVFEWSGEPHQARSVFPTPPPWGYINFTFIFTLTLGGVYTQRARFCTLLYYMWIVFIIKYVYIWLNAGFGSFLLDAG